MIVSLHYQAFHLSPLALNLAVVAAIGTFFDLGPTLTVLFVTLAIFEYLSLIQYHPWTLHRADLARSAIIFAVGALLAWLTQSRRRAAARLRVTLARLEEQAAALRQAQQGRQLWLPGCTIPQPAPTPGIQAAWRSSGAHLRRLKPWRRRSTWWRVRTDAASSSRPSGRCAAGVPSRSSTASCGPTAASTGSKREASRQHPAVRCGEGSPWT